MLELVHRHSHSSHGEWREPLKSRPGLKRFAEVHIYLEPHLLLSMSLQHPEYTWKLFELNILSRTYGTRKCRISFVKERSTIEYNI